MANKRDFKKSVDAVGASICEEMMIAYYNVENADKDSIANAIEIVLAAVSKSKNNSNVIFDRGVKAFGERKEYSLEKKRFFKALFNKIESEFAEEVNEAVKIFNNAIPSEVKAKNKEIATA